MRTINIGIHEAEKQRERGIVSRITCSVPEGQCPFLNEKSCIKFGLLPPGCPYGKTNRTSSGVTKRAKGYYDWIKKVRQEHEEFYANNPALGRARDRVAVVGDYVYVPTTFASMNEEIPFVMAGGLFNSGTPFIKRDSFTAEIVVKIANFVPRTLFGDKIPSYQKEGVPKFLYELKQALPDVYAETAKLDSTLEDRILNLDAFIGKDISVLDMPDGDVDVVIDEGGRGKPRKIVHMVWGDIPRGKPRGFLGQTTKATGGPPRPMSVALPLFTDTFRSTLSGTT